MWCNLIISMDVSRMHKVMKGITGRSVRMGPYKETENIHCWLKDFFSLSFPLWINSDPTKTFAKLFPDLRYFLNVFISTKEQLPNSESWYRGLICQGQCDPMIHHVCQADAADSCGTGPLFSLAADGSQAFVKETIRSAAGPEKWTDLVTPHQETRHGCRSFSNVTHLTTVGPILWTRNS